MRQPVNCAVKRLLNQLLQDAEKGREETLTKTWVPCCVCGWAASVAASHPMRKEAGVRCCAFGLGCGQGLAATPVLWEATVEEPRWT